MRIGIVTTRYERGASYVSRNYMNALQKEGHEVYIFAHGGDNHSSKRKEEWNASNVTRVEKYRDTTIPCNPFFSLD